jgi:hypothetical protein
MLINLETIYQAPVQEKPYKHAIVDELIDINTLDLLLETAPTDSFNYVSRYEGSDKTYKVHNNIIYPLESQVPISGLQGVWLNLINDLTSVEYKQAISDLIKFNINNLFVEITFKKYSINDYISPHTDRSHVPVTHVIFLNKRWEKNWGGEFCILESETNIVKEIIPTWQHSVIFRQSENSWHSVNRCIFPNVSRMGLQVAFWSTQEKIKLPGRNE